MNWTGRWEVRAVDERTTEVRAEGAMHLPGLRRVLEPLMGREVRRSEEAELVKLKEILEK